MVAISKERADELDVAWQAATDVERLSLNRVEWWSAEKTTYFEVEPSKLEKMAASRIAELEAALRTTARDAEVAKRMLADEVVRDEAATELIVQRIEADCRRARVLLGLLNETTVQGD
jgi:hypothetical protein